MVERSDTPALSDLNASDLASAQARIEVAQVQDGTETPQAGAPSRPAEPQRIVVGLEEGPAVRLPEGASIEQPRVNGTDLEFVQPDGSVFVVPEGAVIGLTIFIGSVEIPPLAVSALFETNNIEAAAGPEGPSAIPGSGGNFVQPTGTSFDTAGAFSDLLSDTAFAFGGGGAGTQDYNEVNVAPAILSEPHAGVLVESADNPGGLDADPVDVIGSIQFEDFNLADTFTTSVTGRTLSDTEFNAGLTLTQDQIEAFLAGFSITPAARSAGSDQGSIGWRYTLNNSAVDFLAAGETVVLAFEVTIDDGQIGTATTVTITVQGTNDVPVITSQTAPFVYDEAANVTDADTSVRAVESGQITFSDVDLTDQHGVSHDLVVSEWLNSEGNAAGTLPADVIDALQAAFSSALALQASGGGAVSWSFNVPDRLFDFLADDESLNLRFDVSIDDGQGGTATQPIHVTINGSNDIPDVEHDELTVPVGDFQDLAVGSSISINVFDNDTDADVNDILAVTRWASFGTDGIRHYHYHTNNPSFPFEAVMVSDGGEAIIRLHEDGSLSISPLSGDFFASLDPDETFRITLHYWVTDGQGAEVLSRATIYITGENVGTPETGAVEGAVIEAGHALDPDGDRIDVAGTDEAEGKLYSLNTGADPMEVDSVVSDSFTDAGNGTYTDGFGTLTFDPATGEWHYTLDNDSEATQALRAGETVTHTITFTVSGNGFDNEAIALEITITGTNDLPAISAARSGIIDEEILAGNDGDSYDDGGDLDPNGATPITGSLNVTWALDDYADHEDAATLGGRVVFSVTNTVSASSGTLISRGEAVELHISDDGRVLTGYVGGSGPDDPDARIVFEATVDPDGNGIYTFDLQDVLDHPLEGSEDDIEITFNLDVIDNEGVAQDHSFTVTVNDDAPVAAGQSSITVAEADLKAPIDWGSGNFLDNLVALLAGGADAASGQLADAVDFGADGAHADNAFVFTDDLSSLPQDLKSGGDPVQYGALNIGGETVIVGLTSDLGDGQLATFFDIAQKILNGTASFGEMLYAGIMAASANFNPVFSLSVDEAGEYTFRLFDPLDHEGTDSLTIDFSSLFTAVDGDGDTVPLADGSFTVQVTDDAPTLPDPALTGTMTENEQFSAHIDDFDFGADGQGTVVFDTANVSVGTQSGATLGTPVVAYDPSTGNLTVDPGTAFDALGAGESATIIVPYTLTDGDGDARNGAFTIEVTGTNDAPIITIPASANAVEQTDQWVFDGATISDVDSDTLAWMKISFATRPDGGHEVLSLNTAATGAASGAGLTVSFVDGVLTIAGTASRAVYQTVLDGVVYRNGSDAPTATRTLDVVVNDGHDESAVASTIVSVTPSNDAPVLATPTQDLVVTEGGSVTITAAMIGFIDPDDTDVTFHVSDLTGGHFANGGSPAISFTASEIAAGLITFQHDGGEGGNIDFTIKVEDGNEDNSTPVPSTFTIKVTPVNDTPVANDDVIITNFSGADTNPETASETPVIAETGGRNHTLELAQEISRDSFKIADNADLGDDALPSVTIEGEIESTFEDGALDLRDFYKVELKAGETLILDVDHTSGWLDARLSIFSAINLFGALIPITLAANDDASQSLGGGGSQSGFLTDGSWDPYLEYTASEDGTYYIAMERAGLFTGSYELNISIDSTNAVEPTPQPITISFDALLANDFDPDGDPLNLMITSIDGVDIPPGADPGAQRVAIDWGQKTITIDPTVESFTYKVQDESGAEHTATVDVQSTVGNLNGSDDPTILAGGNGDDFLVGGDSDDFLFGGGGNDLLTGGAGNDTLTGGNGNDTFVFAEAGSDTVDTITDYVVGEDEIDLTALLETHFADGDDIDRFVDVTDNGTVRIDTSGNGDFVTDGSADVAILDGISSGNVTIRIDDDTFDITI